MYELVPVHVQVHKHENRWGMTYCRYGHGYGHSQRHDHGHRYGHGQGRGHGQEHEHKNEHEMHFLIVSKI